jgi:hypothetical protein
MRHSDSGSNSESSSSSSSSSGGSSSSSSSSGSSARLAALEKYCYEYQQYLSLLYQFQIQIYQRQQALEVQQRSLEQRATATINDLVQRINLLTGLINSTLLSSTQNALQPARQQTPPFTPPLPAWQQTYTTSTLVKRSASAAGLPPQNPSLNFGNRTT